MAKPIEIVEAYDKAVKYLLVEAYGSENEAEYATMKWYVDTLIKRPDLLRTLCDVFAEGHPRRHNFTPGVTIDSNIIEDIERRIQHGIPVNSPDVAHLLRAYEYVVAENETLRVEDARHCEENGEYETLLGRLSRLLTGTANGLKGDPGPLRLHDWSDLPKWAQTHAQALDDVAVLIANRGDLTLAEFLGMLQHHLAKVADLRAR